VRFTPHASSGKRFAMHYADRQSDSGLRPLSEQERAVILALLDRPFVGRDELIDQLPTALAKRGCDSGCPTIALAVENTVSRTCPELRGCRGIGKHRGRANSDSAVRARWISVSS
jgi:hypothetical protein